MVSHNQTYQQGLHESERPSSSSQQCHVTGVTKLFGVQPPLTKFTELMHYSPIPLAVSFCSLSHIRSHSWVIRCVRAFTSFSEANTWYSRGSSWLQLHCNRLQALQPQMAAEFKVISKMFKCITLLWKFAAGPTLKQLFRPKFEPWWSRSSCFRWNPRITNAVTLLGSSVKRCLLQNPVIFSSAWAVYWPGIDLL